ncbi:FliA/WhiG family RNA polymerase sigma factor [Timonella senegalensis]|uniref:FliA/WhiG family RNA polymerase sigma factor n=1 Tax=Timonella senegalensis TaxID=1465825 RepID=UPI0028AB8351|nr:FliA/WhiG family RNA polymerase sigma factor [Timonella senegalensis]
MESISPVATTARQGEFSSITTERFTRKRGNDPVTAAVREEANRALWEGYYDDPTPQIREALILAYVPLVASIANKMALKFPNSVESSDLVSYGMFGLIDAIDKFDVSREIKFETYASTRIRGAIIDEMRAIDWVPRSVRSKARAYDSAYIELEASLHRAPTNPELATKLEITDKELRNIQWQLSSTNMVALDEIVGAGERLELISAIESVQRITAVDPAHAFEERESREILGRVIDQLNEREKIIVSLYYFKGMTLAEIGRTLGVTESRVSQMHSALIIRLRRQILEVSQG